jgi:hypothetical protein
MQRMPLGEYELFKKWSGFPRTCANGEDRAWFGGQVVDGLCDVLDEHLAAPRGDDSGSAAIGCVPWLTSEAVINRLDAFGSLCVVIDKGTENRKAARRLLSEINGFPNAAISGLAGLIPADNGELVVVGPYTPREVVEHVIESVRIVGWRGNQRNNPILHAKILVLGQITSPVYDTPYGLDEGSPRFKPQKVWLGSANWTEGSRSHLEVGFLSHDPEMLNAATDFVADVIAFSEPFDSDCAGPDPNMLPYEEDDAAMWEASENQRIAHEEWEAEQREAEDYDA